MGHKRKHESKSENDLEEKEEKKLKLENKEEVKEKKYKDKKEKHKDKKEKKEKKDKKDKKEKHKDKKDKKEKKDKKDKKEKHKDKEVKEKKEKEKEEEKKEIKPETSNSGSGHWNDWSKATFHGDTQKKEKFLRLLGAKKSENKDASTTDSSTPAGKKKGLFGSLKASSNSSGYQNQSAIDDKFSRKMENDMEKQFEMARQFQLGRKKGKRMALGSF
ncbi:hypothetical protein PIROE2DRAFT_10107 [Piromyces sp. E2]|nr:hypothetical protein PIROE2DRAFT_10107 [Piromyces sp. E2]|eukprot:OUM63386.1 hypothetical protein PIROE2DRAFT_10107 [Piromyces sp. E2]